MREKNQDYPDQTSEEYLSILAMINAGIDKWEERLLEGIYWKELYATMEDTSGGTSQEDAPEALVFPGSSLWIGNDEYDYYRPEDARVEMKNSPTTKLYYITGGRNNYKINISPVPTSGQAFEVDYYVEATKYSTGEETTALEMADPYYAIYYALGMLYLDDENDVQAGFAIDTANEKMDRMIAANEKTPLHSGADDDLTDVGFGH